MLEFANGSTASHAMLSASARAGRSLFIQGTLGEIEGFADKGAFVLRKFDPKTLGSTETEFDFTHKDGSASAGHYGGDAGLIKDFIDLISGRAPSISCTSIEDSINGHLCVYAADNAMKSGSRQKV
jgi:hypothetical protein